MRVFNTIGLIYLLMFSSAVVSAAEIEVETKVEGVTIYHSGALVVRTGITDLKPGINELVFKNLSSKIVLNSLKIENKGITILNKSIIRKLTKEEYSQLIDKKDALNKQINLIESKYNEVGFVSNVKDLEKMTAFYSYKILQSKKNLREVEEEIDEAKKLENIEFENENAAILKLIVSIDEKLQSPLKIQYVCGGIGWSPSYEVTAENSSNKSIEVKYLARTMSQTGEDWNNVSINLSSSFPLDSPTTLPVPKSPWIMNGNGHKNDTQNQENLQGQQSTQQQIDRLEGVNYKEINIPSFLKLITLEGTFSIKSNSTVFTFPIKTVELPTHFYYYGFPSLDPEVYLVAEVTGWNALGFVDGIADITYNGNNVGKSIIKFSESKDTLLLPIGKDNSVFLKRSEINDQKYFNEANIGKKRKTTLAYRFELKNNNSFPITFELNDQVPISQTKSAQIEIDKISNGKLNDETGGIRWMLDLNSNQSIDKELVFTIETDAHYSYSKNGRAKAKFRTISAPSF